MKRKKKKERKK